MQSFIQSSEESESLAPEFDMTNHHDNILSGIQAIQKIYETTSIEARLIVERAYVEYLNKLPKLLEIHTKQLNSIKSCKSTACFSPSTSLKFHLLKFNIKSGSGFIKIINTSNEILLSPSKNTAEFVGNLPKILSFEFYSNDCPVFSTSFDLIQRLSMIPLDQFGICKDFSLFFNEKNSELDFSLCIRAELGQSDKLQIIKLKNREIQKRIKKLKQDSSGIDIQKEFKQSCCDCVVI